MATNSQVGMWQGPSGIAQLLATPGLREGMMMAGLRLMGSDTKRESFGQALGGAVTTGMAAYTEKKKDAEYNTLLNDPSVPEGMRGVLKAIGRERGAVLLAQGMMAGPPEPVAVGVNERLANPVTGEIVLDAVPQASDRDVRTIGDTLVEVPGVGTPQVIYDAPDAGPDAAEVGALRDDFERNILPYETSVQAYRKLEAAATGEATPQKDLALVFNYMKTIEPNSSVQQGEYATAQNSGSAFDIIGNLYNRVITGQRLNEVQRRQFLNAAREQLASQLVPYQQIADQYRGIAQSNRYDPAQIIRDPFTGLNLAPEQPAGAELSDDEIMRRILGR
jgi:hypothetical protein